MKVWEDPARRGPAEWSLLYGEKNWEEAGAAWYKPASFDETYYAVVITGLEGDSASFYGVARFIDVGSMTLPEALDVARSVGRYDSDVSLWEESEIVEACLSFGRGDAFASAESKTAVGLRTKLKNAVDADLAARKAGSSKPEGALDFQLFRWSRIRAQGPDEYLAGFLFGRGKGDIRDYAEPSEAFEAGWRHGWEFAAGRVPLPEWARPRRSEA